MTKEKVKETINKLFKDYTEKLEDEIDKVLHESDMWYGRSRRNCVNENDVDDRNADLLVADGAFPDSLRIDGWLHTRKEVGL